MVSKDNHEVEEAHKNDGETMFGTVITEVIVLSVTVVVDGKFTKEPDMVTPAVHEVADNVTTAVPTVTAKFSIKQVAKMLEDSHPGKLLVVVDVYEENVGQVAKLKVTGTKSVIVVERVESGP